MRFIERKWAISGKQDWRYGMNQLTTKSVQVHVNLDTLKRR